jgi:prepilin-type N-terminal cleavage/methylation domain-containing protein
MHANPTPARCLQRAVLRRGPAPAGPLPPPPPRSGPAAFTLIELLTVIAIIGVLAAIIIPTVGKVRETAQRTVDASNLREIAKAAMIYAADNNDRLPDPLAASAQANVEAGSNYFRWIGLLGRSGALNDPSFYFSRNDPLFDGSTPASVIDPDDANRRLVMAALEQKTPSFELVGGLKMSDPATTPIAFTRGLTAQGAWDRDHGVYHEQGGHIVFLGGNVQFYQTIDNRLVNTRGKPTNDIRETIPAPADGNQRIFGKNSAFASEDGVPPVAPE